MNDSSGAKIQRGRKQRFILSNSICSHFSTLSLSLFLFFFFYYFISVFKYSSKLALAARSANLSFKVDDISVILVSNLKKKGNKRIYGNSSLCVPQIYYEVIVLSSSAHPFLYHCFVPLCLA